MSQKTAKQTTAAPASSSGGSTGGRFVIAPGLRLADLPASAQQQADYGIQGAMDTHNKVLLEPQDDDGFRAGDLVKFIGLHNRKDLNGQRATVVRMVSRQDKHKAVVKLAGSDKSVLVNPLNLMKASIHIPKVVSRPMLSDDTVLQNIRRTLEHPWYKPGAAPDRVDFQPRVEYLQRCLELKTPCPPDPLGCMDFSKLTKEQIASSPVVYMLASQRPGCVGDDTVDFRRFGLGTLGTGEACVICSQQMEVGSEVLGLPCGHDFHAACVERWLKQRDICPTCRFSLPKSTRTRLSDIKSGKLVQNRFNEFVQSGMCVRCQIVNIERRHWASVPAPQ